MSLSAIVWIITVIFCLIFLWISLRVKDTASQSFSHYAIAGGTLPLFLILFTDIATIMGAGNFIGQPTSPPSWVRATSSATPRKAIR